MKILLFLMPLLFFSTGAGAIDIEARGTWHLPVGRGQLRHGPGSDLISAYESPPAATVLQIRDASEKEWLVFARQGGPSWPSGLTLSVKCTDPGAGTGAVYGGGEFIPITGVETPVFAGEGDRSGIRCQYRLEGMSIAVSPGTYGFNVVYTVNE